MKKLIFTLILAGAVCASQPTQAQKQSKKEAKKAQTQTPDTTQKKPTPGTIEAVLKTNAKAQKGGMFDIYEQDGKYYYMIPTKLLGRDMMLVNRLSQGAAGLRNGFTGYAGDEIQSAMIRFMESPDGKQLFLQNIMTREMPRDSTGEMSQSVMRSNFQPIAAVFKIEARNQAKDSILVEVTSHVNSDNELAAFDPSQKNALSLTTFLKERSYITSIKSYPTNIETKSVKTYNYAPKSSNPNYQIPPRPVSLEINTSMVLLPEVPMKPRYNDLRVGYFTDSYVDYEQNPQGVKNVSMISRFRLEPKDAQAYARGELVEPIKPIVIYIDPTTPEKWVPYLIEGINDWQVAFEKAGFKNAIIGKKAPTFEEDSTWSLEDARYNAIVYKPSDIPNASGPHVSDPRSGETIELHVNWYHNVQKLLRNWYMIQVGPNDPRAHQMTLPDSLMGRLIRFVSSHELGHSLGLRHNMGSTYATPVDSLRSASYLEKYGHAPSIMDYSRYNYVAQPEDSIQPELLFPRINDYDIWAIEFGYRYLPQFETAQDEVPYLNQWIIEKNKDPRLWFGHEMNADDPRSQTEDIGDNQMKANSLGIKNLKRVLEGISQWTKIENQDYASYAEMYNEVVTQYNRYVGHVAKWVGGIYENPRTIEQEGDVYTFVEKEKQQEAISWINDNVIDCPMWLYQPDVDAKTTLRSREIFASIYNNLFSKLVSARVLRNLAQAENALSSKAYTMKDLFSYLNAAVWNLSSSDNNKRTMQSAYVTNLCNLYTTLSRMRGTTVVNADVHAIVSYQMNYLKDRLSAATSSDPLVKGSYQTMVSQISQALEPVKQ